MRTNELFHFIKERHSIYCKRKQGLPKPWTADPILQKYRFCNVYRELDTVTQWISKNWRIPNRKDPDLWFAMVVARFINLPSTLEYIGYPVPYEQGHVRNRLENLRSLKAQIFTGAYMIKSNAGSKLDYITQDVFAPLWRDWEALRPQKGMTLAEYANLLMPRYGFGGFMAGQVIADLKYVEPLSKAKDWRTFAVSGPGSKRGMNWVFERDFNRHIGEDQWYDNMLELQVVVDDYVKSIDYPPLHCQDIQNCLCELGKIIKVQQGWGRPRSLYPGV